MKELNAIKAPIQGHLEEFDRGFRALLKSSVPLLDIITRYIYKRKGKQMRPMFVFLSADICGEISPGTHTAAAMIELLHTATLVHDDVVDDSMERRGFFSINALWKNKIAVLVGDYLLSRGLLLAVDHREFAMLKLLSEATREMSEGELLQIEKARKLDISEEIYFEIIRKKTASLIATCCAAGALSAGAEQEQTISLKSFGEHAGIAFQIKDDLFDYEQVNETGKPGGIDIKEQKMTLPLIYSLKKCTPSERRKVIRIVKNHGSDKDMVSWVFGLVNEKGGIAYANQKMQEYHEKAIGLLTGFHESESLNSLRRLVDFTITRRK
ncbi:MAG: polyprenyl synthetase family protein [Bacteroidales bacterium]|nr:polyprenyl synthetase family protein [Bacteroidales bacterium]